MGTIYHTAVYKSSILFYSILFYSTLLFKQAPVMMADVKPQAVFIVETV